MMMCCLLVLDSVTSTPQWIRVPVACSSVELFLPLEFNSPLESIALLTAFDHADTRFTPLSCPVYNILDVWVVHCRHSGGNRVDLWAWVSALSFRGSPQCVLTLIMNVRAPRITLSLTHSIIVFIVSACASPASVVRGPLPIYLDTLSRVVSLSHKYSRLTSGGVACSVRATAASSSRSESTPSSSRPTWTTRHLSCS